MSFDYLLDANTYIQAKNFHYRMHIVPGFWEWLDLQLEGGLAGTIHPVARELLNGNDVLTDWMDERKQRTLRVDDEATQDAFTEIVNHVMTHSAFTEPHRSTFLEAADPWLVAKAVTVGAGVVTHESKVASDSKKVKIPNVCEAFKVPYLNAYDLLDSLDARLILER